MNLDKQMLSRWLFLLILVSAIGFVISIPSQALDPRVRERLPMGYEDKPPAIENAFDKNAYNAGIPDVLKEDSESEASEENEPDERQPDVLDSGQVLDSGPQQQMYDDISGIRRSLDIIVYFCIPMAVGSVLIYKFCQWFYSTFVESAWNK